MCTYPGTHALLVCPDFRLNVPLVSAVFNDIEKISYLKERKLFADDTCICPDGFKEANTIGFMRQNTVKKKAATRIRHLEHATVPCGYLVS